VTELSRATWRKSSRSNATGNCVEVAILPAGMAVRDSTDPGGPALAFPVAAWRAFVAGLHADRHR
jgi:hypothetical protein